MQTQPPRSLNSRTLRHFWWPRVGYCHHGTFKGLENVTQGPCRVSKLWVRTERKTSQTHVSTKTRAHISPHILDKKCVFFSSWWGGLDQRQIKCHFHFSTGGSNNKSCILYTAHTRNEIFLCGRTRARGQTWGRYMTGWRCLKLKDMHGPVPLLLVFQSLNLWF